MQKRILTAGNNFGYRCPGSVSGNDHAEEESLRDFQVQRARMILLAAQGLRNDEIAARLNTRREVVSQWRQRFFHERLPGLDERPRPGRPRAFPPGGGRSGQGAGL